MSLGAIGALLLVMVVICVVGHLWFHVVEGILERIRSLFTRRKDPPAWHTLPQEEEPEDDRR